MVIEVGSSCLHSERSTSHGNHPALCDSWATHIDVHHTASSPVYIVHYPLMLFLASANTKDNDFQSGDLRSTYETLCYKFLVLIVRLSWSHACVSLTCYWSLILLSKCAYPHAYWVIESIFPCFHSRSSHILLLTIPQNSRYIQTTYKPTKGYMLHIIAVNVQFVIYMYDCTVLKIDVLEKHPLTEFIVLCYNQYYLD